MTPKKKPRSGEGNLSAEEILIDRLQARLDAFVAACDDVIRQRGRDSLRGTPSEDIKVLASGSPARECRRLVKKWGKR